jgi:hypothetical protein
MDILGFYRIKYHTLMGNSLMSPMLWKIRWINLSEGILSVSKDETERCILARMVLNRATTVEIIDVSSIGGSDSHRHDLKYCFSVSNLSGENILFLLPDSTSLESTMMSVINACQGTFRPSENFFLLPSTEIKSKPLENDIHAHLAIQNSFAPLTGYFEKQGHIVKSWKRRYFILDLSCIKYYDDSEESTRSGILDVARSVSNIIRRFSSSLIFRKLKVKGLIHIDRHSKVVRVPDDVTSRRYCIAVISNQYDVGSVEFGGIDDDDMLDKSGIDQDNDERDSRESIGINSINHERKVSLRISFPDEITMNIWVSFINDIIRRHCGMLIKSENTGTTADTELAGDKSIICNMDEDYFDELPTNNI